jgi:hypothetical protein
VDSDEAKVDAEADFWIVETAPFGGLAMSLHGGLDFSRDPRFVVAILEKKTK